VSHSQRKAVANIFAVDQITHQTAQSPSQFQDYTLYLSPLLAFNLGFEPTFWLTNNPPTSAKVSIEKVITPLKKDRPTSNIANTASPTSTTQHLPTSPTSKPVATQTTSSPPTPFLAESYPTASRVTLCRIKGPLTYTRANELRQFFRHPKLLKVGDIIGITVKCTIFPFIILYSNLTYKLDGLLESGDDEEALDDEVQWIPASSTVGSWESDYAAAFSSGVFFRVASLAVGSSNFNEPNSSPLVWVLRGETMVEQRGAVAAILPTLARSYLAPHPFLSATHPLALDPEITGVPCVRALLDVLRPTLYPMSHELGLSFSVLVAGPSGSGKETAIRQVADLLGANLMELDCYEIIPSAHPSTSQVEAALRSALTSAQDNIPCVLVLRNLTFLDVVAQQQQQQQGGSGDKKGVDLVEMMVQLRQEAQGSHHLMLVGTVEKADKLSPALRAWFRHEVEVAPPDESARESILAHSLARFSFHHREQIQHLAKQTVSLSPRDLHSLVAHATLAAKKRMLRRLHAGDKEVECDHSAQNRSVVAAGVSISSEDLTTALNVLHDHHATLIGAPKVPDVKWEDVGGLGEAKKEILDTIQIPLMYPWLFSSGITPRSGILLFGPPGKQSRIFYFLNF
jgi:ATP-dependent 26S proteasome regulatory subunit